MEGPGTGEKIVEVPPSLLGDGTTLGPKASVLRAGERAEAKVSKLGWGRGIGR